MRKLSEAQLMQLEGIIDDGVWYLFLRDENKSERLFRLRNPSHEQGMRANMYVQGFLWELRKDMTLKNREQVEEEFKKELDELRSELRKEQKQAERLEREIIDKNPSFPDGKTDKAAYENAVMEASKRLREVLDKVNDLNSRIGSIYAFSIEWLLQERRAAVLGALCWERKVEGTEDKWEKVWLSWEQFRHEQTALASRLEMAAKTYFFQLPGFFADSPSLPAGGDVT